MKALLWKDFRLCRNIIILGALLFVLPYVLVFSLSIIGHYRQLTVEMFVRGSENSLLLSLITTVFLGSNVIACERVDGSSRFLAYLPPSRQLVIGSKLAVSVLILLPIWVTNVAVLLVSWTCLSGEPSIFVEDPKEFLPMIAGACFMFFGVAWAFSAVLRSTGLPAFLALLVGIMVFAALPFLRHIVGEAMFGPYLYLGIGSTIGAVAIALGMIFFTCRIDE